MHLWSLGIIPRHPPIEVIAVHSGAPTYIDPDFVVSEVNILGGGAEKGRSLCERERQRGWSLEPRVRESNPYEPLSERMTRSLG